MQDGGFGLLLLIGSRFRKVKYFNADLHGSGRLNLTHCHVFACILFPGTSLCKISSSTVFRPSVIPGQNLDVKEARHVCIHIVLFFPGMFHMCFCLSKALLISFLIRLSVDLTDGQFRVVRNLRFCCVFNRDSVSVPVGSQSAGLEFLRFLLCLVSGFLPGFPGSVRLFGSIILCGIFFLAGSIILGHVFSGIRSICSISLGLVFTAVSILVRVFFCVFFNAGSVFFSAGSVFHNFLFSSCRRRILFSFFFLAGICVFLDRLLRFCILNKLQPAADFFDSFLCVLHDKDDFSSPFESNTSRTAPVRIVPGVIGFVQEVFPDFLIVFAVVPKSFAILLKAFLSLLLLLIAFGVVLKGFLNFLLVFSRLLIRLCFGDDSFLSPLDLIRVQIAYKPAGEFFAGRNNILLRIINIAVPFDSIRHKGKNQILAEVCSLFPVITFLIVDVLCLDSRADELLSIVQQLLIRFAAAFHSFRTKIFLVILFRVVICCRNTVLRLVDRLNLLLAETDVVRQSVPGSRIGLIETSRRNGVCQIDPQKVSPAEFCVFLNFAPSGDSGTVLDIFLIRDMVIVDSCLFIQDSIKFHLLQLRHIGLLIRRGCFRVCRSTVRFLLSCLRLAFCRFCLFFCPFCLL